LVFLELTPLTASLISTRHAPALALRGSAFCRGGVPVASPEVAANLLSPRVHGF